MYLKIYSKEFIFVKTNSYIVIKTIRTFNTNELFTSCLIGILNRLLLLLLFVFLKMNYDFWEKMWWIRACLNHLFTEAYRIWKTNTIRSMRYHTFIVFYSEFRNDLIHLSQIFSEYIAWMSHNDYIYSLAL